MTMPRDPAQPRAVGVPTTVYDAHGPITMMVRKSGYVMCRRPRCMPLVLKEADWLRLPRSPMEDGSRFPALHMNGVQWDDPRGSFQPSPAGPGGRDG